MVNDAKKALADSENASLKTITATSAGSKTILEAELTFKDARQIGEILKSLREPPDSPEKCQEELIFGDTNISVGVPKISFTRLIDVRSLVPAQANNAMTLKILGDATMRYTVHLPTSASTHNADSISDDGKRLTWQVPIARLIAEPVEMKFTAPLPNLSLYLTLAVVLLFLLPTLCFLVWRRLRKQQAQKP